VASLQSGLTDLAKVGERTALGKVGWKTALVLQRLGCYLHWVCKGWGADFTGLAGVLTALC
jgi:hypothetical protein